MAWNILGAALYLGGFYMPFEAGISTTILGGAILLWRVSRWKGFGEK